MSRYNSCYVVATTVAMSMLTSNGHCIGIFGEESKIFDVLRSSDDVPDVIQEFRYWFSSEKTASDTS